MANGETALSEAWGTVLGALESDERITPQLYGFLSLVEPRGIMAGTIYLVTAALLGAMVLVQGFTGDGSTRWARNLFLTSIVYLPVLFAVMVMNGRA